MRAFFILIIFSSIISCGTDPVVGTIIVFGDVIGSYEGECASFDVSSNELENRETATMSVFAANQEEAGINASCDRFDSFQLKVISANASQIEFRKTISANSEIKLIYFSEKDSISLTQTGVEGGNIIFAGIRK